LCVRLRRESHDALGCRVEHVDHDAHGEDALGQAAGAYVMRNRGRSPDDPDTIWGVVWQQGQCSWTEDGRRDRMTALDAIGRAVESAVAVSRGKSKDPTGGARHDDAHHQVQPRGSRPGDTLLLGEHTLSSKRCKRAGPECDREGTAGRAAPEA
jgi:spore germination cell wall hydrolase CwlJ-like protein